VLDRAEQVTVPALHIGGWFGQDLAGEAQDVVSRLGRALVDRVFLPGHRIRLEVSSSNFPRYDRNSNTGGVIVDESASEVTVAVNRVLHGPAYPSRLILPVIRR
jgi:uncharacterized protein